MEVLNSYFVLVGKFCGKYLVRPNSDVNPGTNDIGSNA